MDHRELATVVAALRLFKSECDRAEDEIKNHIGCVGHVPWVDDPLFRNDNKIECLSQEEIDALIENLTEQLQSLMPDDVALTLSGGRLGS